MSIKKQQNFATILLLVLACIALAGFSQFRADANYQAYFSPTSPHVASFKEMQEEFLLSDSLLLVLESDTAFSDVNGFFESATKLVQMLNQIEGVRSIQHFLSSIESDNSFKTLQADKHPLISSDKKLGVIAIQVDLENPGNPESILSINDQVKQLADSQLDGLNIQSYLAGTLGLNYAYITTVRHDLKVFLPGLLIVCIISVALILRSLSVAILLFLCGLSAIILAAGFSSWWGISFAAINAFSPVIIFGLCIVTLMHNIVGFYQAVAEGRDRADAIDQSFQINFKPLTLSSLSTAAGFLLLLLSPSPPIKLTGILCAAGIVFSYLICLSVLSRGLCLMPVTTAKASRITRRLSIRKYSVSTRSVGLAIGLVMVSIYGLSNLHINDNVYRYFSDKHSFRYAIKNIDEKLDGSVRLNVLLRTKDGTFITQENFSELKSFFEFIQQYDQVVSVIPNVAGLNRQSAELLLTSFNRELSVLKHYISKDNKSLRIEMLLKEKTSSELLAINEDIRLWLGNNTRALNYEMSGSADMLFARLSLQNAKSMFIALAIALCVISFFLVFFLQSFSLSVIAFACNFFPLVVAYGLWSIWGGNITLGSAVVVGMIMGIIVDDTIHMLLKFKNWKAELGFETAFRNMHYHVLPVVIMTSGILILAFSVGLFSGFRPINEISMLSMIVIGLAWFANAKLLPAAVNRWVS